MKETVRFDNPRKIDPSKISAIISSGRDAAIQFSQPGYSRGLLSEIDALCGIHGERLELRFYHHTATGFDASWLEGLNQIQALSLDCLSGISSGEHLSRLTSLKKLSLEAYDLDDPAILSRIPLGELTELSIGQSRKSNIDLRSLETCEKLEKLNVTSHCKGLEAIRTLPRLAQLMLHSIPAKQSLEMVSGIPRLSKLKLLLGGRPHIDEIACPMLEELEIVRLQGLTSVGDLARFPTLARLNIEDQIHLRSMNLERAPGGLQQLGLRNCKNLQQIGPLQHLGKLEDLTIQKTAIDLASLIASGFPPSLKAAWLRSGKRKEDAGFRASLDSMGYEEFSRL